MNISKGLMSAASAILFWLYSPNANGGVPEYFGYNTQGGSASTMSPSYCWGNKYSTDFYTASGNEVIDTFVIWCNPQNNNNKIVFGLYTVEAGSIRYRSLVSDTLTLSGTGVSRWALPANLNLLSDRIYTICIDIIGSGGPAVCYAAQSSGLSRSNNATFPDTWSDDQNYNMRYCVAAHISVRKNEGALRRRVCIGGEK